MTQCAYYERDYDDIEQWESCDAEATHTNCNYYGAGVCEAHKCRCGKPLFVDGVNACIVLGRE